jgi:hypothetical protein
MNEQVAFVGDLYYTVQQRGEDIGYHFPTCFNAVMIQILLPTISINLCNNFHICELLRLNLFLFAADYLSLLYYLSSSIQANSQTYIIEGLPSSYVFSNACWWLILQFNMPSLTSWVVFSPCMVVPMDVKTKIPRLSMRGGCLIRLIPINFNGSRNQI